jgi:hypothetical protein
MGLAPLGRGRGRVCGVGGRKKAPGGAAGAGRPEKTREGRGGLFLAAAWGLRGKSGLTRACPRSPRAGPRR